MACWEIESLQDRWNFLIPLNVFWIDKRRKQNGSEKFLKANRQDGEESFTWWLLLSVRLLLFYFPDKHLTKETKRRTRFTGYCCCPRLNCTTHYATTILVGFENIQKGRVVFKLLNHFGCKGGYDFLKWIRVAYNENASEGWSKILDRVKLWKVKCIFFCLASKENEKCIWPKQWSLHLLKIIFIPNS